MYLLYNNVAAYNRFYNVLHENSQQKASKLTEYVVNAQHTQTTFNKLQLPQLQKFVEFDLARALDNKLEQ